MRSDWAYSVATKKKQSIVALIGPVLALMLTFNLLPLLLVGLVSIQERDSSGGVIWGHFTPEAYFAFLFDRDLDGTLALNTDYLSIFLRSFELSGMTTLVALIIGFPTALYMALQSKPKREFLMFLVTIPFWTSLLVRNYAWILLLRRNGLLDDVAHFLHLTEESLGLLNSNFAIALGLVYSFLPFMVLPIYASLEKFDWHLVEAAADLGASRWVTLRRIIIPLSIPGIVSGSTLVFIPCLGSYVTPLLLGGGKALMIGNLIQNQFGVARNWPFGAALAFALLLIVLGGIGIQNLILRARTERRRVLHHA